MAGRFLDDYIKRNYLNQVKILQKKLSFSYIQYKKFF